MRYLLCLVIVALAAVFLANLVKRSQLTQDVDRHNRYSWSAR